MRFILFLDRRTKNFAQQVSFLINARLPQKLYLLKIKIRFGFVFISFHFIHHTFCYYKIVCVVGIIFITIQVHIQIPFKIQFEQTNKKKKCVREIKKTKKMDFCWWSKPILWPYHQCRFECLWQNSLYYICFFSIFFGTRSYCSCLLVYFFFFQSFIWYKNSLVLFWNFVFIYFIYFFFSSLNLVVFQQAQKKSAFIFGI